MLVIAKALDSYHYEGDVTKLTANDVKDFIKKFKNGEIPPYIKS